MSNENVSVLVIEDDAQINALLGAYAKICGFEYRSAVDGATALAEASRQAPTAVILDVMLPDFDGFEICRRLRQNPQTSATPIIMLSALGTEKHRRQGRECGCNAYLTKPFDPDHLMKVLTSQTANAAPALTH